MEYHWPFPALREITEFSNVGELGLQGPPGRAVHLARLVWLQLIDRWVAGRLHHVKDLLVVGIEAHPITLFE